MAISKIEPASLQYQAGTGPAFSAVLSGTQALSTNVFAKVTLNSEQFDTNNNFDTSTYRFTPTVAGYYQVNAQAANNAVITIIPTIYKNGAVEAYCGVNAASSSNGNNSVSGSLLVYMNGSTDYLELYCVSIGSTSTLVGAKFSGFLARAA